MTFEDVQILEERKKMDPESFVGIYVEFHQGGTTKIGGVYDTAKDCRLKIHAELEPKPNKYTNIEPQSVTVLGSLNE